MTLDLDALTLTAGAHEDRGNGLCLMEAVAWFAGEGHSDHPVCVSPVLGAFGRVLNDVLPDGRRQDLKPLVPLLPGTAGDGKDQVRGLMAADWLVRVYLPAWLELAGLDAGELRGLPVLDSGDAAAAAQPVLDSARARAAAAWDIAGDAAWDAAGAAACEAAWDAAFDAAWDAARDAPWDAPWVAAWVAARDAARDAAGDAAGNALAPTVIMLQDSAVILFRRMIAGVPGE